MGVTVKNSVLQIMITRTNGVRETILNAWSPKIVAHLHSDESSPAVQADRAWFNVHVGRKHYVRATMDGEDLMSYVDRIVVRREEEGFRYAPMPSELVIPDREECAAVMYEMVRQAHEKVAMEQGCDAVASIEFDVDEYCELVALERVHKWLP